MKTCTFVICILLSAIASFATAPASGYLSDATDLSTANYPTIKVEPFSVCIEAEDSEGTAPVTEDPNASNGKTRGVQTEWNHYVDYVVSNAPAGRYEMTIRYYAEGNALVWISVNGAETAPVVGLPATNSWNIVWGERTIDFNLTEGYNKIRIGGLPFHSPTRQDRICLVRIGDTNQPASCDFDIRPYSVETYPIYTPGQTMNLSANCTGGDCAATTFAWSGNGVTASGGVVSLAAPMALGDYTYSVTASKPGCPDKTATMPVRVQTIPAACDYIVGTIVSDDTPTCGQGIGASADCFGTGCLGLNYRWTGPGLDISGRSSINFIAPSENGVFTYTRTSSKPGCPDKTSNFKLTVTNCGDGPFSLCLESEDAFGTGPVTEDPNASGGKTRGGQDRSDYFVEYFVPDVPVEGPHAITLRYYAEANTAVEVQINSEANPQIVELPASNSWNIVWVEKTVFFNLKKGLNSIAIKGLPGHSPVRQDKICVVGAPVPSPSCDFNVTANSSTLNPSCGAVFSLGADCTGPGCASVSYQWSGDGPDQPYQLVNLAAPSVNGSYAYTITATKNGCSPKTSTIHYSVTTCPPAGGPLLACVEAEHSISDGQHTSDPNASNGLTVGVQNNYNYYVDYQVNGLGAGLYPVTLRYYAEADAQVSVSVNGNVAIPALHLAPTYSWNIVWREETFYVTLPGGYNTIRIQGLPATAIRQDKICVGNAQSNARMAAPEFSQTQNDAPLLQAFPNPASGEFKAVFNLPTGKPATIRVTDVQGKIWHTRRVTGRGVHEERIDLGNAPAGIYLLQVKKPDSVETKKILLAR